MDSTDSGSVKGAPAPTPREREVLALLAERLTNREIADRLYVSVRTVESHVSSLLVKTGAANRRELAEKARALLRAMPAHNLPPRRTTFVGREEELGTTIGLLEEHRQVTLAGPPGVGKTRLAIEVGRAWLDRTGDGVYLVELASLRDPDLVTTEVQSILRAPSASTIDPLRSLADHVGSRPLLIVLDNCEHVRTPAAKVAETLVDSCPRVKVIATSRVVLGTKSEQVLTVGPLEREPAVRLFLERSGGTWGDRELGALVSRLDGLPLAIELAAARSRVFEPEELVSELERGFSVLASIATDSRYQTLEGAINWSYQLLDPTDRDLLAAVTVFQGGFSLEAAKRVCAGSPHVAPSLARLVDHSLLTVTRAGRSRRFRLLESIKTFAAEFRDPDVDRAHADYCLDLAARASSGLRGRSQQRWLETLDTELDELRGAFDWARRNDPEIALRLFEGFYLYWEYRGQRWEGVRWAERLFDVADRLDSPYAGRALAAAAWTIVSHDTIRSREQAERAVEAARRHGDAEGLHRAKVALGHVLTHIDPDASIRNLSEAVEYFSASGDTWWEAFTRARRSDIARNAEDARRARELFRDLGDLHCCLIASRFATTVAILEGDLDRARRIAEEALALARRLGNDHEAAEAQRFLGRIALATGDPEGARVRYEAAIPALLQAGDLRCSARALVEDALARHRLDDAISVVEGLADGWSYATRVDDNRAMAEALSVLALRFEDETSVRLAAAAARLLGTDTAPLASEDDLAGHLERLPLDDATRRRATGAGTAADPGDLFSRALESLA